MTFLSFIIKKLSPEPSAIKPLSSSSNAQLFLPLNKDALYLRLSKIFCSYFYFWIHIHGWDSSLGVITAFIRVKSFPMPLTVHLSGKSATIKFVSL